ncbi:putative NBD/HSP70 family sugar kinase [Bosea sp. BE125]|uniref:ROK family protein n=1 Tax=Bosea sp. BE125 TaxID=2817909 RepID=UPI00285C4DD7|nr:ROK family protein [Bosea sp. BE125]MDR6874057.1 putative NBD/HSP70 family sugar kinase [Bosea sp. BE125]
MPHRRSSPSRSVAVGTNPERTRSHNRRVVLETVRQHGRLGRSDIAALTRLTAQAVSNIVAELVDEGFLIELGRRRTARGQPPMELAVNADGGMTAGMEIAADHITTVLVDLAGEVRAQRIVPLGNSGLEAVQALAAAELALARTGAGLPRRLLGCGVVMPGPFEIEGMNSVGSSPLPGWAGHDAGQLLSLALQTPVTIENDATAAAVGEHLHGLGRNLRHFCLIYFGAGLGLGSIIGGQPYRGAFGNAGEIGHIPVVQHGLACACGGQGCLERYASTHALSEALRAAGIAHAGPDEVARLHLAGHPAVLGWITEAARLLAPMLVMLENLFDPETIILGGGLPDGVIDALIDAMSPLAVSVSNRSGRSVPRVQRGATGRLTAALGAAALPLLDTMTPKLDRTVLHEQDETAAAEEQTS